MLQGVTKVEEYSDRLTGIKRAINYRNLKEQKAFRALEIFPEKARGKIKILSSVISRLKKR